VDEIFRAQKGFLYLTGELTPFVNSIFEYPAMIIPTYGLAQYLFGPEVLVSRILSSIFFIALIAILYWTTKRLSNKWAAIGTVLLVISNMLLVGNYTSGTLYSVTTLLILLVIFVETFFISRMKKTAISGVLIALAILFRINMIPAVIAYLIYMAFIKVRWKEYVVFLVLVAVVVTAGYIPIVAYNPELAISRILLPFASLGPFADLPASTKAGGFALGEWLDVLTQVLREFYPFILLSFAFVAAIIYGERRSPWHFFQINRGYLLAILFAGVLFASHFFYPKIIGHPYYFGYVAPFFAMIIGIASFRYLKSSLVIILLFSTIILNLGINVYRTDVFSAPGEETDLARISRGAELIENTIPADAKIVTFDNSLIHLFEANRRIPAPLLNRNFLFINDLDTEKVRRLGMYNLEMLQEWIDEADYLVLHREKYGESFVRRPLYEGGSAEEAKLAQANIQATLDNDFLLEEEILNVYPRKYTEGNDGGTLQIYKRR